MSETKKCPKCGATVEAGAQFCPECGNKFKKPKAAPGEIKRRPVLGVLLILLSLWMFGSGFIGLFSGKILLNLFEMVVAFFIFSFGCAFLAAPKAAPKAPENTVADGEKDWQLFLDVQDDAVLAYWYEQNIALDPGVLPRIVGHGGDSVSFVPEPNNEFDSNAVAILLNGSKLGYIYRGNVQNIVNDYLRRGWPVCGYINKYSLADQKATYKVGLYKPVSECLSKTFTLAKTKKRLDDGGSRLENLEYSAVGDSVFFEENDDSDGYVVFNENYREIGELPAAGAKFLSDHDGRWAVGILESNDEGDDGKVQGVVRICII